MASRGGGNWHGKQRKQAAEAAFDKVLIEADSITSVRPSARPKPGPAKRVRGLNKDKQWYHPDSLTYRHQRKELQDNTRLKDRINGAVQYRCRFCGMGPFKSLQTHPASPICQGLRAAENRRAKKGYPKRQTMLNIYKRPSSSSSSFWMAPCRAVANARIRPAMRVSTSRCAAGSAGSAATMLLLYPPPTPRIVVTGTAEHGGWGHPALLARPPPIPLPPRCSRGALPRRRKRADTPGHAHQHVALRRRQRRQRGHHVVVVVVSPPNPEDLCNRNSRTRRMGTPRPAGTASVDTAAAALQPRPHPASSSGRSCPSRAAPRGRPSSCYMSCASRFSCWPWGRGHIIISFTQPVNEDLS